MAELEVIELSLREFEALRCCDLEGLDQEQASMKMNISRATVHRLLKSGRRKLLNAIVKSHALKIEEPPLKRRKKHEQK